MPTIHSVKVEDFPNSRMKSVEVVLVFRNQEELNKFREKEPAGKILRKATPPDLVINSEMSSWFSRSVIKTKTKEKYVKYSFQAFIRQKTSPWFRKASERLKLIEDDYPLVLPAEVRKKIKK